MPCIFIVRIIQHFLPRRLASNCAHPRLSRRSRQLVSFEKQKLHTEIRTHDINAAITVIFKVITTAPPGTATGVLWSQNYATEILHRNAAKGVDNAMPCHRTGDDKHNTRTPATQVH